MNGRRVQVSNLILRVPYGKSFEKPKGEWVLMTAIPVADFSFQPAD
jgi:hypothetical protein